MRASLDKPQGKQLVDMYGTEVRLLDALINAAKLGSSSSDDRKLQEICEHNIEWTIETRIKYDMPNFMSSEVSHGRVALSTAVASDAHLARVCIWAASTVILCPSPLPLPSAEEEAHTSG